HSDLHSFPTRRSSDLGLFEDRPLFRFHNITSLCNCCTRAFMYPMAYAIPACHGALHVIFGVWSGINTPSNPFRSSISKTRAMSRSEEHTSELQSREKL